MTRIRRLPLAAGLLVALAAAPSPAHAAFPGNNGKIAFSRGGDIYLAARDGTGAARLTSGAGNDADPAWSPDGRRIAFTSDRDGSVDVYVMNSDATGITRLTTAPGEDADPAWSPDGTQIAFVSDRTGARDIWAMGAGGANQHNLTNTPLQTTAPVTGTLPDGSVTDVFPGVRYGHEYSPAWSPNGAKIAFSSDRTLNASIYTMNADGSGQVALTGAGAEGSPSWSPDGTKIAYQTNNAIGDGIAVMTSSGALISSFVDPFASDSEPAFSPDGQSIVFRGLFRPTGSGLYRMPLVGSGLLRVTAGAGDQQPDWQPCPTCSADQTFVPPAPPPAPAGGSSSGGAGGAGGKAGSTGSATGGSAGGFAGGASGSAGAVVTPKVTVAARVLSVTAGNIVRLRASDSRQVFHAHLIGIDVPKTNECGGPQTRSALRRLLRPGTRVRLTTDRRVPALDSKGRVNGYLTLASSGKRVEEALVTAGWAKAKSGVYLMARRHKLAQAKAKKAKRGVWKRCGGRFHARRG